MQYANLEWRNNVPYSLDFNDVYFSTDDGLQETQFVFIDKNNLIERFKKIETLSVTSTFTIIETGFGTGLNFLAIANCWLEFAPVNAKLQFISIEKTPLNVIDLARAQALWPQFSAISQELIQQYVHLKPNYNHFNMAAGHIKLSLWACDVKDGLTAIDQTANAWVLDGFAPAKNQEMWSQKVFEQIARLSTVNTSFATFTSAGYVRRGLQAAGFNCTKHKGYGKKREMLSGIFTDKVINNNE